MKQCNSSKKLSICWYWAFAIVTIRSHHHSHLSIILFWLPFQWHCHQLVFLFHRTSHHAPSVFNVAALSLLHKLSQGCVVGPLLFIMYTTPQLVTLALSLMNISPSLAKISALSKSCYSLIRALRCIRPYLDQKTASTIATSFCPF